MEIDVNLPNLAKQNLAKIQSQLGKKLRKLYSIRMPDPQTWVVLCKVVFKLHKFKEFLKIVGKFQVSIKNLPHLNEA